MATNIEALVLVKDLLRLGAECSSKVGEYVSVSKNVLPSVTSAADELGALRSIVSELEDNFQDYPKLAQMFPHDAMNDLRLVLTSCKKVFAQLRTAMHQFLGPEQGGAFAKMFMPWRISCAEKDLAKIQRALVAHKAALNITLLLTKSFISQGNPNDTGLLLDKLRGQARIAELDTPSDLDLTFSDVSDQSSPIFTPHTDGLSELDSVVLERTPVLNSGPTVPRSAPVFDRDSTSRDNTPMAETSPASQPSQEGREIGNEKSQVEISLPFHHRASDAAGLVAPVKYKDHKPKPSLAATDTDRPLIEAAKTGDVEMMEMMLMLEPNINANDGNYTTLSAAAVSNKVEAVQLLLDSGADPNAVGTSPSALKGAIEFRHDAIGVLLLQRGADPNLAEKHRTPFCQAARDNRVDLVAAMIKHGDVNVRETAGNFPLIWAAHHGHAEIVSMLVGTPGIDINMQNDAGVTALIDAAKAGHPDVISLLVAHGAAVNTPDKRWGNSPLIWASWEGGAQRYTDSVKALIAAPGIDLNPRCGEDGSTAVKAAAHRGHIGALRLMLAAGADAHLAENNKTTPLMWAAYYGHLECVQTLLDVPGADTKINAANTKGVTTLYDAATEGHEQVVALLLARGADPNIKGGGDGSALMTAVKRRRTGLYDCYLRLAPTLT